MDARHCPAPGVSARRRPTVSETTYGAVQSLNLIDPQPFEALETKIGQVLDRLSVLQSERNELQKQASMWQSRYEETARQLDEISRERDSLKRNQRDSGQEELIRTKITALLAKLEAA